MIRVAKRMRFDFEDGGYFEVRRLEGDEVDTDLPISLSTHMNFVAINVGELKELGEFLINASESI
jgi:hypothetical protein